MSWFGKHRKLVHVAEAFAGVPGGAGRDIQNTGGGQKIANYSLWSNHNAHQQASNARENAASANRAVGSNVNDLRSLFGMYSGPDAHLTQQSNANQGAMQANYGHYRQAYLDYFQPQLNDQFNTATHNDLFAGVNSGTGGGSADRLRQQGTLNKYVQASQQVGSKANQAVNDLTASDQSRELSLEDQIRHGGDANYLINQGLQQGQNSLSNATAAIPGQALGDVFNNAGNLYEQGQIAQGYGRRGLGFGSSTTSNPNGQVAGT